MVNEPSLKGGRNERPRVKKQPSATTNSPIAVSYTHLSADEEHLSEKERYSDKILRTPDVYGYFTATYMPVSYTHLAIKRQMPITVEDEED